MIVEYTAACHEGIALEAYFGISELRRCMHDSGYECDQLFHYCRLCSMPLDDCDCDPVEA